MGRGKKRNEEREEQKRVDEKWRRIEEIRIKEKRRAEKEWRRQEM